MLNIRTNRWLSNLTYPARVANIMIYKPDRFSYVISKIGLQNTTNFSGTRHFNFQVMGGGFGGFMFRAGAEFLF